MKDLPTNWVLGLKSIVDNLEGKVNTWPLDEGLIDYVDQQTIIQQKMISILM